MLTYPREMCNSIDQCAFKHKHCITRTRTMHCFDSRRCLNIDTPSNAPVTYDAAIILFCGVQFVDSNFINFMDMRAAVTPFINVTATILQSYEFWNQIPWGDRKETRRHLHGDRTAPSWLLGLLQVCHEAVTRSPWGPTHVCHKTNVMWSYDVLNIVHRSCKHLEDSRPTF